MRLKTLGFELATTADGIEYDGTETSPGTIVSAPDGIGRAFEVYHNDASGFVRFAGTAEDGPFYFRAAVTIMTPPDDEDELLYVAEVGIQTRVGVVLRPDLTLYLHEGFPDFLQVGEASVALKIGQRHVIEIAYTNNPDLSTTKMEARLDGNLFASDTLSGSAGPCNMFGFGWLNPDDNLHMFIDDIAVNNAETDPFGNTDQIAWPGDGRVLAWRPSATDFLGNSGWTRGGFDGEADVVQVASPLGAWDGSGHWDDPIAQYDASDDASWLTSATDGDRIDFEVTSPYKLGLLEDATISVVTAQVRWRAASDPGDILMNVYLRAGSNLAKAEAPIALVDMADFYTGNGSDSHMNDVLSITRLPNSNKRWTTGELTGLRFGMQSVDSTPDIEVSAIWGMIEYLPHVGPIQYSVEIGGNERAYDVEFQTLLIEDNVNESVNRCSFRLYDLHGVGEPINGDPIVVKVNDVVYFSGEVVKCTLDTIGGQENKYEVQCIDYSRVLDRRLVAATYTNMTDKQIIEQIISDYAADDGVTTYHVAEGATISRVSFNYVPVTAAIESIAKQTSRNWFIDYQKDIHYFPVTQYHAPFDIDINDNKVSGLQISKDAQAIRNRIFVRGGVELTTSPITETQVADGEQRQFLLAEKPHGITMTVGGVSKTIGIKNIDDAAAFDYLLNYQEKYVEAGTGTTTPTAGTEMAFTYNYDVPILVSVEDAESITEQAELTGGSGVYEFVIIDNQIGSTQQARDRAAAELTDWSSNVIEGSYDTIVTGIRSGQFQHIELPSKNIDSDYMISSVTFRSIGGGVFTYEIKLTSAKRMGIIKYLLQQLQLNRTIVDIDPNEKVDQLMTFSDTLDSIMDSALDSLGGTAAKWSNDAGSTTNKLQWGLGQWK